MKKTILTTLGLAAACAACCAAPLLLSSAVGLSLTGLAISEWGPAGLTGTVWLAGSAALVVGSAVWLVRRRRQAACAATACKVDALATDVACGCAAKVPPIPT